MNKKIKIHDMIADYLKKNSYGGLVNPEGECACELNDLFSCGSGALEECCAGYKIPCTGDNCPGDCDWHITTEKPESQIKYMKEKLNEKQTENS